MEVKEIKDKKIWEDFLLECQEKTFLQSWNWGEFQKKMGNKIWRLGVFENDTLIELVLAVKIVAKRGKFLLVQHWLGMSEILLNKLKEIAKKERCSFIRVASLLERNEENKKLFRNLGFREAPMHASAYEATWKLDIRPPEEELLKNMRKTTRYLIRQAQKDVNIETFRRWSPGDVDIFYQIQQEVARVQRFTPFSLEYLKKEFSAFLPDDQVSLFFGKYKGEIIAAALVIFWSNIGFYHQAALLPKYHKIPIAYLLQWEAIKEAKKRECILYDFWGYVNPKENPKHPWAGPTLFKMGFGGQPFEYVETRDFPLSLKYWLIFIFEKLRKIKRGL